MPRAIAEKTVRLIDATIEILTRSQPMTVRGVAYQWFTRGLIPDMSTRSTSLVSRTLKTAREKELIPWSHIVDETRPVELAPSWSDPGHYMATVWASYRQDRWTNQPERVIVLSEKATVAGLLRPVMNHWGVPFCVLHGWSSTTALHELAERSAKDHRPLTILYVGDFDPSGRYMADIDVPGRLQRYGGVARIEHVAVTLDQIARHRLPTFTADEKKKDARYGWFVREHGTTCCELDALDPNELRAVAEAAIRAHVDIDAWTLAGSTETAEMGSLKTFLAAWPGLQ